MVDFFCLLAIWLYYSIWELVTYVRLFLNIGTTWCFFYIGESKQTNKIEMNEYFKLAEVPPTAQGQESRKRR